MTMQATTEVTILQLLALLILLLLLLQVKPGHDHVKEFHMHVYWLQNNPQQVRDRQRRGKQALF